MTKKASISTILLFVFSLMLAHNIVPHHHNEISEVNNQEHHHHDNNDQDHHNENDEPIGLFSHPTHILVSKEFTSNCSFCFEKTHNNQFILNTNLEFILAITPIKRKSPNWNLTIPLKSFCTTYSLRGPPLT